MTPDQYQQIAELISLIRNARFGEMVQHLEKLIDSGAWQDFTTPAGTHFEFRPCEFDYFLAVEEVDPTLVRTAYLRAENVPDLARKQLRLADITGRGKKATDKFRRPRDEVAEMYRADPSGAGQRIREFGQVVTDLTAQAAKNPERRKAMVSGNGYRKEAGRKRWVVEWRDDKSPAEAITEKLLKDEELAHEVYKALRPHCRTDRVPPAKHNRRSEA